MAGKLSHPDETYSREDIVHMFGLFSKSISNTDETTCHFCLDDISQSSVPSLNTECCNQPAHCKCFETWSIAPLYGQETFKVPALTAVPTTMMKNASYA